MRQRASRAAPAECGVLRSVVKAEGDEGGAGKHRGVCEVIDPLTVVERPRRQGVAGIVLAGGHQQRGEEDGDAEEEEGVRAEHFGAAAQQARRRHWITAEEARAAEEQGNAAWCTGA